MLFDFFQIIINIQKKSGIYLMLSLYDTLKGLKTGLVAIFWRYIWNDVPAH